MGMAEQRRTYLTTERRTGGSFELAGIHNSAVGLLFPTLSPDLVGSQDLREGECKIGGIFQLHLGEKCCQLAASKNLDLL